MDDSLRLAFTPDCVVEVVDDDRYRAATGVSSIAEGGRWIFEVEETRVLVDEVRLVVGVTVPAPRIDFLVTNASSVCLDSRATFSSSLSFSSLATCFSNSIRLISSEADFFLRAAISSRRDVSDSATRSSSVMNVSSREAMSSDLAFSVSARIRASS